jgi:hypothetical protein
MTTTNVLESSTHLDDRFSVGLVVRKTSGEAVAMPQEVTAHYRVFTGHYNGIARVKTKASTARQESFGIAFVARPRISSPQKYRECDEGCAIFRWEVFHRKI